VAVLLGSSGIKELHNIKVHLANLHCHTEVCLDGGLGVGGSEEVKNLVNLTKDLGVSLAENLGVLGICASTLKAIDLRGEKTKEKKSGCYAAVFRTRNFELVRTINSWRPRISALPS
jgi:hypothetical protein